MKVILESQLGNFGNQAQIETAEMNITYYRSSGVQDDQNNAVIYGKNPSQHILRVMKTATGTYELQIKQNSSYRDALVKIQVLSTNGGTVAMSNGKVTGSSSGTEYTPSTNAGAQNLFPGIVQGKRIEGAAETSNTVPIFTFDGDEDTGLGYISSNSPGLIAGGSRKFYVNSTNAYFQNLSGGVQIDTDLTTDGIKLNENTTFYSQNATISYYSSSNGVYVNGAGNSGWLRLNASGTQNSRNSIDLYGSGAGDYVKIKAGNTDTMYIGAGAAGRVGIGTSTPQHLSLIHI